MESRNQPYAPTPVSAARPACSKSASEASAAVEPASSVSASAPAQRAVTPSAPGPTTATETVTAWSRPSAAAAASSDADGEPPSSTASAAAGSSAAAVPPWGVSVSAGSLPSAPSPTDSVAGSAAPPTRRSHRPAAPSVVSAAASCPAPDATASDGGLLLRHRCGRCGRVGHLRKGRRGHLAHEQCGDERRGERAPPGTGGTKRRPYRSGHG